MPMNDPFAILDNENDPFASLDTSAAKKGELPEKNDSFLGDTVDLLQRGASQAVGGALDFVGADDTAQTFYDIADQQLETLTPETRQAMDAELFSEDGDYFLGKDAGNARAWLAKGIETFGMMALPVPGGAALSGVARVGLGLTKAAKAMSKAKGIPLKEAKQIVAKDNKFKDWAATTAGYGGAEGAVSAGMSEKQVRDQILNMDQATLEASEPYQTALQESGGDPQAARQRVADTLSKEAAWKTFGPTALLGAGAGRFYDNALSGMGSGSRTLNAVKGGITEAAEEMPQSAAETLAQNTTMQQVDPSVGATDGMIPAVLEGGVFGAGTGAALGGVMPKGQVKERGPLSRAANKANPAAGGVNLNAAGETGLADQSPAVDLPVFSDLEGQPDLQQLGQMKADLTARYDEFTPEQRAEADNALKQIEELELRLSSPEAQNQRVIDEQFAPADEAPVTITPKAPIQNRMPEWQASTPPDPNQPVVRSDGNPFKNQAAATLALNNQRKQSTHKVAPIDGGFGLVPLDETDKLHLEEEASMAEQKANDERRRADLVEKQPAVDRQREIDRTMPGDTRMETILRTDGKPFANEATAQRAAKARRLTETHRPVSVDGGFALAPNQEAESDEAQIPAAQAGGPAGGTAGREVLPGGGQPAPVYPVQAAADPTPESGAEGQPVQAATEGEASAALKGGAPAGYQKTILNTPKKAYLKGMERAAGISKKSPGYKAALADLEGQYESDLDRAYAELPFEEYNAANSDIPESLNRQVHAQLRMEHGIDPELSKANPKKAIKPIDEAAHEAATSPANDLPEPTQAQKEAGNYKVGKASLHGLEVSIENPKGSERTGVDPDGKKWSSTMKSHYGYFNGTVGKDKDHVDTFVGPDAEAENPGIFVVDQVDPKTGKLDEHKIMFGWPSEEAARTAYLENYEKGWKGLGAITQMPLDEFKVWVKDPVKTKKWAATKPADRPSAETVAEPAEKGRNLFSTNRNDRSSDRVVTVAQANKTVSRVLYKVGLPADTIEVIDTYSALPDDVKADAKAQNADGKVKGVLHKSGSMYVVADQHSTESDLEETVLHELMGHLSIRKLFGKNYVREMNRLFDALGGWGGVRKIAQNRGFKAEIEAYRRDLFGSNSKVDWSQEMRVAVLTDELMAAIAQRPKVMDRLKAVIGTIRQWLRDHGFARLAKYGETDLMRVLQQGRRAITDKHGASGKSVFMVAYHGTPYSFDKFSLEAIGTGEGAQAYGWGLYFAGKREIAEWYKNNLSYKKAKDSFLDALPEDAGFDEVMDLVGTGHFTPYQDRVIRALNNNDWLGFDYPAQAISAAYRDLSNYDPSQELRDAVDGAGNLYQVDIPEDSKLLDWDKPLSEQPEGVRLLLHKIEDINVKSWLKGNKTGRLLYEDLTSRAEDAGLTIGRNDSRKVASEMLNAVGIPGLRYLDNTGRREGTGTYNYVIWDESKVTVEAVNDELQQAAMGAVKFSRKTPAKPEYAIFGMPVNEIESTIAPVTRAWTNAPDVVVAENMDDPRIPEAVRTDNQRQLSQGATGDVEGFIHNGAVYLVAENLNSPEAAVRVLLHEAVGHAGLQVFGKRLHKILDQIADARRADVAAKAKEYGLDMNNQQDRRIAAEEVLAEMAQTRPEIGFVRRAVAAIRDWLRQHVPAFRSLKLTDDEIIQQFLIPARDFIENGRYTQNHEIGIENNQRKADHPVRRENRIGADAGGPEVQGSFSRRAQSEGQGGNEGDGRASIPGTGRAENRQLADNPSFRDWFGDSKVVDAEGNPRILYRGESDPNYTVFDKAKQGSSTPSAGSGYGHFFGPSRRIAEGYGDTVREFYLSIQNPFVMLDEDFREVRTIEEARAIAAWVESQGYDGIYVPEDDTYIAFNSDQIKLTDNDTFTKGEPDIRYSRSAVTDGEVAGREEDDLNSFSVRNKAIREQNKPLFDRAKKILQRNLTSRGLLPESVFNAKIERDSDMGATEMDIGQLVGRLERAVRDAYGQTFRKLTDQQQESINHILGDGFADIVSSPLPESVKVAVTGMRNYIDRLSEDYVSVLAADADRLDSEGNSAEAESKAALLRTIASNIGAYVNRSYRAFDDPKWFSKVPDDVLNAARTYLEERGASNADQVIETILKEGTAADSMEAFIKESKLGAKDLSILRKRKQVAPEIRALLGEYTDPRVNFAKSATKMSRLLFNDRFLKKVMELGEGSFLFTDENRPVGAHKQFAADGSEAYAPLNGYYTFPEIEQAFKDVLGKEQLPDWYRAIVQVNGMVKYGKTVLSPTTAMRNWMSAYFFTLANGHFNLKYMKDSFASMKSYFKQDGDRFQYLRDLKQLGVIYDTPYAGEMMRLLEDTNLEDKYVKSGSTVKSVLDTFTKFYQFGDDFWKVIGFENEVQLLMEHKGLSREEAKPLAAKRIRDTYPTYSMVSRSIQKLRRFPLAGTFVSFPAEIVRTSFHILKNLQQDLADPDLRPLAMRRIAGLAIVSGFAFAAQEAFKQMIGMDDEEEEAMRVIAPKWSQNSNIVPIGRDEKGNLRYIDLSFLDPYNYFKRPITALMRDEPAGDMAIEAAREMLEPFLGEDILFGTIAEIWHNRKESGGRVYNEDDSVGNITIDIAKHMKRGMQPGIVANIEAMLDALSGYKSRSGRVRTVSDEIAANFGFRVSTIDPGTSLFYRAYEFRDIKRNASSLLSQVASDPNDISDDELLSAYRRSEQARAGAYTDMFRLVHAARKSGMQGFLIRQILRANSISKADVSAILRGEIPKWRPSSAFLRSATKKAKVLYNKEAAKMFMERKKLLQNQ